MIIPTNPKNPKMMDSFAKLEVYFWLKWEITTKVLSLTLKPKKIIV